MYKKILVVSDSNNMLIKMTYIMVELNLFKKEYSVLQQVLFQMLKR